MGLLAFTLYVLGMVPTHALLLLYVEHPHNQRALDSKHLTAGQTFIACILWPLVAVYLLLFKEPR